jgi:nucleotide-binding universal stress UspA family protein
MTQILVATDLSDRARKALVRGLDLARRFDATLTVLHVVDADQPLDLRDAALRSAEAWLGEELQRQGAAGVKSSIEVMPGSPDATIVEVAASSSADLVVMGAHRRHRLRDVFVGTTIERVIRATDLPVLMVNRAPDHGYDKALVAVDFSAISDRALRAAAGLAYLGATEIILLHACQPIGRTTLAASGVEPKVIEAHAATTVAEAAAQLRLLAQRHAGTATLRDVVEEGPPVEVIERVATREAAPLVVLGSRSHSGILRFLMGSTAESYLRTTTETDVLVVSPSANDALTPPAAPDRS